MKARFGSIPDNEKWVDRPASSRGFFISAPCNRRVEFQESRGLGLVKGTCKGIERAGFTVIASNMGIPSFWASQFSKS